MATPAAGRLALSGVGLAVLLTLAHTVNDAFTNVLPVFLPILQERFGLGEAVLASFVALISFSSNVMQAFAGALADRWGRRRAAALGLILGSTLMSFLAVVSTLWALVLVLAIGGLGSAIFHPSAASMVHGSGTRKGLGMGLFMAGGPLGSALMPVVVLYMLRRFGPEYVPWLAVLGVAIGLLMLVLAPSQERPTLQARPRVFDPELFLGPVGLLSVAGIFRAVAFISFTNAMPLYLVNVRGLDPESAVIGWTLACYSGAASVGVLAAGALEQRFGRMPLAVGSMILAVPLLLVTLALPVGTAGYFLAVAGGGLATNFAIPLLLVSAQDRAPHAVASASGMLMGFTWGVAGVLYVGFGAVQEWLGLGPALSISFAFPLLGAALAYGVLREPGRASAEG